jgi:phosphohistidine phosphatase
MQLFIMRHGQAEQAGKTDSQRELTLQGYNEARTMGNWLSQTNNVPNKLFVSPFKRAQQTAATIIESNSSSLVAQMLNFITPSGDAGQVHDYLDSVIGDSNKVLVVSHMPLVSYLVADLTFDNNSPIFQTAAIAQIDYDVRKMKGQLVRLISPSDILG